MRAEYVCFQFLKFSKKEINYSILKVWRNFCLTSYINI